MGAVDGEKLVAALLDRVLEGETGATPRPPVAEPETAVELSTSTPAVHGERPSYADRPRREERMERRPRRDGRDRERDRDRPRDRPVGELRAEDRGPRPDDRGPPREDRGPRGPRPERDRDRDRDRGRGSRPARASSPPGEAKEFWEVWSEEVGRTAGPHEAAPAPAGEEPAPPAPSAIDAAAASGQTRLYLNVGRKDGASEGDVAALIAETGVAVGPGDLDVMNTHTYVNVAAGDAERLVAALTGKQHNGRALVCEPARPPRRR
jgi:hypothetical protein